MWAVTDFTCFRNVGMVGNFQRETIKRLQCELLSKKFSWENMRRSLVFGILISRLQQYSSAMVYMLVWLNVVIKNCDVQHSFVKMALIWSDLSD